MDDPEWPLAYLAHWARDSSASSVAGESDLRVCGFVDLRVKLRTTSGERVLHVFFFRILRGGSRSPRSSWLGPLRAMLRRWGSGIVRN